MLNDKNIREICKIIDSLPPVPNFLGTKYKVVNASQLSDEELREYKEDWGKRTFW